VLNNERVAPAPRDARQLVRALYEAFGTKDIPALDAIVSDDWLDVPMSPGQAPGRPGLAGLINHFHETFSDVFVTVDQIISEGDAIAARVVIHGVQVKPFLGIEPKPGAVEFSAHDFHVVRDGRIVRTDHLEDLFGYMERAGAFPE